MRLHIAFTVDVERSRPEPEPEPEREYPPQVDAKGSFILERAAQEDFDPTHRVGFLRNEERP